MAFCPDCRSEYRRGIERCPTCDVALVDQLEQLKADTTHEGAQRYLETHKSIPIMTSTLDPCREVRDHLLACGVPCLIAEHDEPGATDVPSMFQRYDVMAAEEDVTRIREEMTGRWMSMLDEGVQVRDQTVELTAGGQATCPACGTKFVVEGDECPECGLYLGA